MDREREHKELTVKEVFGLDQQGSTKAVAARAGFKYVWTRSGVICGRKTNGSL